MLIIFSIAFFVIFNISILPKINMQKEEEYKENLVLFKILYSNDMYSIWNTNTQDFLVLKTIEDNQEKRFVGIFDNPQSVYSLFDRSTNPWKSSYKIIKISRNMLMSQKFKHLDLQGISINGRTIMNIDKFINAEIKFYQSIIDGRLSSQGIEIGEEIYKTIEENYIYIQLD